MEEQEETIWMFRADLTPKELENRTKIFQEFLRSIEVTEEQEKKIIGFRFDDINF